MDRELSRRASCFGRDRWDDADRGDDVVILVPLYNDWSACRLLLSALDDALAGHVRVGEGHPRRRRLVPAGPGRFPGTIVRGPGTCRRPPASPQPRASAGHRDRAVLPSGNTSLAETVVLMDSDGEDAPSDVPRLLARYRAGRGPEDHLRRADRDARSRGPSSRSTSSTRCCTGSWSAWASGWGISA